MSSLISGVAEGGAGQPRIVIHPDGMPAPQQGMPALDKREWDILSEHVIIHRSLTPRRKI